MTWQGKARQGSAVQSKQACNCEEKSKKHDVRQLPPSQIFPPSLSFLPSFLPVPGSPTRIPRSLMMHTSECPPPPRLVRSNFSQASRTSRMHTTRPCRCWSFRVVHAWGGTATEAEGGHHDEGVMSLPQAAGAESRPPCSIRHRCSTPRTRPSLANLDAFRSIYLSPFPPVVLPFFVFRGCHGAREYGFVKKILPVFFWFHWFGTVHCRFVGLLSSAG